MKTNKTPDNKLTSYGLACLIVDALIDGGCINKKELDKAIDIAEEEIDARKAVRDY